MAKQNPSRMIILLPMMFLMNKVDFENEVLLNSARAAYVLCQVLSVLTYVYIKKKVTEKNDTRKIFVPGASSPFDQSPNYAEVTESTYVVHELAKADEVIKQTLIGAFISAFIHVKMGVNHVVLIQSVMTPLNLYDNPLVQAYILGRRDGRIWNEKLEGEPLEATTEEAGPTTAAAAAASTDLSKVTPSEAIAQALAAGADADFDLLWEVVKVDVNAVTTDDRWTALMVACGSPIDTDAFIGKIVAAGANLMAVDGDGWTALHWSAFHGRPEAAEALLAAAPKKTRAKLVAVTASDGRTALQVAEEEGNADVAEIILKVGGGAASKDESGQAPEEEDSALRRRKPTTTTAVDDVD